jgi:hypothetical protein
MLSGSFIYCACPRRANSCGVGHWTRVAFDESGMNFISKIAIMAEQNKTASPHVAGPSTDRPKREILPAFLATHRSLTDPAISEEHQ